MHRLKTRPQFQAAMAGGILARTAHFALHRLVLVTGEGIAGGASGAASGPAAHARAGAQALFASPGCWVGAMAPKRWARRAVTRNAIKRQIYAVAALHADRLPPHAFVVRLRSGFDRQQFISPCSDVLRQAVRAELMQLFARALAAAAPKALA